MFTRNKTLRKKCRINNDDGNINKNNNAGYLKWNEIYSALEGS
jgi:hypothetical protein